MDDILPILPMVEELPGLPSALWPAQLRRPSAKLLDSEAWFSEERLMPRAGAGPAGGDLP